MNAVPYEIIAGSLTVWYADVGTAFPAIDTAPGAGFTLVGTAGDLNYMDDGITLEQSQSINLFRALGDAGSRKAFRTQEDLKLRLVLVDLRLESYKLALNANTISTVAAGVGTAGYKKIGLSRGFHVDTTALLARAVGLSPYGENWNLQFEIPRAAQTGNPAPVFKKGEPAGLALEWTALVDPNASSDDERFGRILAQTADAET